MLRFNALIIIAVSAALFALLGGCSKNTTGNEISVGVLVPLTGGAASYGQNSQRGVELALKDFASSHPDIKVKLKVEDSRGEASVGLRAAQKMVEVDGVQAVVGCVTSGVTLAVAPLMNERKIPIISPGGSSPKISDAGDFVFRTWPSDTFEAEAMARLIAEKKFGQIAILKVNNEYGSALEGAFKAKLPSESKVILTESFEQGARDMRTQLEKIKASGAQALYFIGFPEAAVVLGNFYSTVGLSTPIFATSAFEDPQVPQKTGGVLNGTIYAKPVAESAITTSFKEKYKKTFGSDAGVTSDTAYDAATIILNTIAGIVKDGEKVSGLAIQKRLYGVSNFQGASGTLTFDNKGDVIKPIGFFILRDGKYQEYKTK
jgi:branched-chain amino acid transport system substrate-binding protein